MGADLLERDVEKKMVKYATENKILTYKFTSPSNRGVCDRIFIYKGDVVFCEVKRTKGVLSKLQIMHIRKLTEHGGNVVVVYGLDEGHAFLSRLLEGDYAR